MADRPQMPVTGEELSPRELCAKIEEWAQGQGYECEFSPHAKEFCKVMIRSPDGEFTNNTIPNAHRGRRLRRDQVRYVIQRLNSNWRASSHGA
jgi:hypothetical protein